MSAVRTAILLVLAGVAAPVFAEQITCESRNERTEACTTLQPGSSVRMVQQISNSPCIEGQTWGTGADRELQVYRQSGNIKDVVSFLIHETMRGVSYAQELGLPDPTQPAATP